MYTSIAITLFATIFVLAKCDLLVKQTQILVPLNLEKYAEIENPLKSCITETGVDPGVIATLRRRVQKEDINEEFKSYILCVSSPLGIVDEDGHFIIPKILEYFPEYVDKSAIRNVFEQCNNLNADTRKETYYLSYFCYIENTPAIAVLP